MLKSVALRWVLFSGLVLAVPRQAGSGVCRGEGERTALYLEYLGRQINILLDRFFWAVNVLPETRRAAPELARFLYAMQAREVLESGMMKAAPGESGLPGEWFRQLWPLYQEVSRAMELPAEEAEAEKLRETAKSVAESYFCCRAAAQREPAWCEMIADEKIRRDCPRFLLSFRLLSGDCGREGVEAFASAWGAPVEVVQALCQALGQRRDELCPTSPEAKDLCRALARNDKDGCLRLPGEKAQQSCLQLQHTLHWLEGKSPLPSYLGDDPYPLFIRGWLQPERCLPLALEWWDRRAGFPLSLSAPGRPQ